MSRPVASRSHTVAFQTMTLAEQIELACLLEATARKPGNVHPGARFDDLCYDDFVRAAASLGPCLERSHQRGDTLGETILRAVEATRYITASNANLGIILLLAPLTSVPAGTSLHEGLPAVLAKTTVADAERVYEAIRLARPGGLGQVDDQDISDRPTITLRDAMSLAVDRDAIANQYVHDFATVQEGAAGLLGAWMGLSLRKEPWPFVPAPWGQRPGYPPWEVAIILVFCRLLSRELDSLVVRKCGLSVARTALAEASRVVEQNWPFGHKSEGALQQFDGWLRTDGHRRNPGTTADLIAACLFWAIREGYIQPPTKAEVLEHARQIAAAASA